MTSLWPYYSSRYIHKGVPVDEARSCAASGGRGGGVEVEGSRCFWAGCKG